MGKQRGRPENLIPNSQRTHEELSEMGRKGGIESGKTRRYYRDLKKALGWIVSEK